ncbi:uncharacterized protein [Watersipora subatra]|uniref:uncharacterized protein n=1 Tax=Watersipora subatra TaxID=2589382 RepID=UPI00355B65FD
MLYGNKGTRGENEHSVVREVAQKKLVKEDRVSEHSNGYSIGQVTPGSRRSIDNLDQDSPTFTASRSSRSVTVMEKDLKSSIAKLYQNYDFITDEYDRLYEIVDKLREDYNNSKNLLFYNRYKEFRRVIKNALRQWKSVEKRSTLAMSRKTSNTNYTLAMSVNRQPLNTGSTGSVADGSSFSANLDARLKAQNNAATRDLYAECTRLEREIYQYKIRNQTIKNLISKLAESYENSKAHVLHIWGRFKELRDMIKEVIDSDV